MFPVSGVGVKVPLALVPESTVALLKPAVNSEAVNSEAAKAPVKVPVVVRFSLSNPRVPVLDVMVPEPFTVTLISLTPT
jgi:hypothetical protein